MASTKEEMETGNDYFKSYSDLGVHELMLQDRPRTIFYRKFFETHRDLVKGKVVMDVGAGTGILSLFAATAGAKKVYAIEASDVASLCEEIVKENNFESVIEVIHGAVESISLPDDVCVDIIVSEWMGFYLLHESMLDSVLVARDRFLASDGIMVPSSAFIYMAPVDMSEHFQDRADYWNNIYGYDFSPIASTMNYQEVTNGKPLIKNIDSSFVKSEPVKVLNLDLKSMDVDEVKRFSHLCKFTMTEECRIHGFVIWFDVCFNSILQTNDIDQGSKLVSCEKQVTSAISTMDSSGDAKINSNLKDSNSNRLKEDKNNTNDQTIDNSNSSLSSSHTLSTGPSAPATHWKQTVVFLPQTIMVAEDILLCCKVKMNQDSGNKRHYNISIELKDESDLDDGEENSSNDGDSDDSCDHPVPCDCGSNRCRLISALVEKYDTEHLELEEEAVIVQTEAEVEAAKEIDTAIEKEGWTLDSSGNDAMEK